MCSVFVIIDKCSNEICKYRVMSLISSQLCHFIVNLVYTTFF